MELRALKCRHVIGLAGRTSVRQKQLGSGRSLSCKFGWDGAVHREPQFRRKWHPLSVSPTSSTVVNSTDYRHRACQPGSPSAALGAKKWQITTVTGIQISQRVEVDFFSCKLLWGRTAVRKLWNALITVVRQSELKCVQT